MNELRIIKTDERLQLSLTRESVVGCGRGDEGVGIVYIGNLRIQMPLDRLQGLGECIDLLVSDEAKVLAAKHEIIIVKDVESKENIQ